MTERYRAENERSTWMRFHTQTAGVSLTPQQPLNNLTRVAIQALAGDPGRDPVAPHRRVRRGARRPDGRGRAARPAPAAGHAEETGVASTVDPLGGSWFVEALTNEVEREVWRYLDEIDRRGGMVAAIAEGYPQREIADAAYRFQREFDAGERVIVGVNGYDDDAEPIRVPGARGPRGLARAPPGAAGADPRASATPRRSRPRSPGLREAASRPGSSDTNLMPHFIRCAEALRDARRAVRACCARSSGSTGSRSRSARPVAVSPVRLRVHAERRAIDADHPRQAEEDADATDGQLRSRTSCRGGCAVEHWTPGITTRVGGRQTRRDGDRELESGRPPARVRLGRIRPCRCAPERRMR